jgi:hypothetical protein
MQQVTLVSGCVEIKKTQIFQIFVFRSLRSFWTVYAALGSEAGGANVGVGGLHRSGAGESLSGDKNFVLAHFWQTNVSDTSLKNTSIGVGYNNGCNAVRNKLCEVIRRM